MPKARPSPRMWPATPDSGPLTYGAWSALSFPYSKSGGTVPQRLRFGAVAIPRQHSAFDYRRLDWARAPRNER